jgi:hypothetical protein
MSRTYPRRSCSLCGREISTSGLAWTNHMRKHVREGLATERIVRGYCEFEMTDAGRVASQQHLKRCREAAMMKLGRRKSGR